MSCDAIAGAFLWLAASTASPQPVANAAPPPAVAGEPLFAEIVKRAGALKADAEAMRKAEGGDLSGFSTRVGELAALDMQGHKTLAQRGTDGDLKCILKGIAEDLPVKLGELKAAQDTRSRDLALREMVYLLNDNVEVILAPPAPPV